MQQARSVLTGSPAVLLGLLRAADLTVIVVAGIVAYLLRHGIGEIPGRYWVAVLVCALLASQVFHFTGLYRFALLDRIGPQLRKLTVGWAVVWTLLVGLMFFTKTSEDFSRAAAALWLAGGLGGFLALRIWLKLSLRAWRRQGLMTRNVAVVGAGDLGRRLVGHLLQVPEERGIRLAGVFDDRRTRVPPSELEGVPMLGNVDALLELCRREQVDLAVIALPWSAEQRIAELIAKLRQVPVDVQLCPEAIGFRLLDRPVSHLAGLPMLTVFDRPLAGWNYVVKSIEDRVLAALILLAIWPAMLAIALAIRLDSDGPVLFRQRRYGFNNNEIVVLKFRTMRLPGPGEAAEEGAQARRADPRVTRVGAFLRRTSLDELPQFINVLRGEMSIVGPRPHAVAHNVKYAALIQQYYGRHRVKPGITGWAQIHGFRGETDRPEKMEQRVAHDLYYIDNWSLGLDLRIILRTLLVGFVHDNAY